MIMHTILIPVDFSQTSIAATMYAAVLAKKIQARLILYHVVERPPIESTVPINTYVEMVKEEMIENAYEKLRKLADDLKLDKSSVTFSVGSGRVPEEIARAARHHFARLIIMGTNGDAQNKEIFVGRNAASVIEKSQVPVLAIPGKSKSREIHKIAVEVDFLPEDIELIKKATDFASYFDAEVMIFHASTLYEEKTLFDKFRALVKQRNAYPKLDFRFIYGKLQKEKELNYLNEENMIDLLVNNTCKKSFTDTIFQETQSNKTIYNINMPLLTFHAYSEEPVIA
jgi:nucleotide-binding universal stress UspA family protein